MGIYFEYEYGKLYEQIENGICDIFTYECDYGKVRHMFIKRKIAYVIKGETYYDIITPYGYGGPIISDCEDNNKLKLVQEFKEAFQKYCDKNNIVSEFVRFHPLLENALDFERIYNVEKIRNTVGTNVAEYDDPFTREFSKSTRKTVRRALKDGLSFKITQGPEDISTFKEVYYSTMDRNDASDYYYFDDNYFNHCLCYLKENILLVEVLLNDKVISAGFYFIYDNIVHAHLSGTLKEFMKYSPAYILKYATVVWAKENGVDLIHYGGGITNQKTDSLYQFKKKFGVNTEFDFYIAKKIWNQNVYDTLCDDVGVNKEEDYFPAYRNV